MNKLINNFIKNKSDIIIKRMMERELGNHYFIYTSINRKVGRRRPDQIIKNTFSNATGVEIRLTPFNINIMKFQTNKLLNDCQIPINKIEIDRNDGINFITTPQRKINTKFNDFDDFIESVSERLPSFLTLFVIKPKMIQYHLEKPINEIITKHLNNFQLLNKLLIVLTNYIKWLINDKNYVIDAIECAEILSLSLRQIKSTKWTNKNKMIKMEVRQLFFKFGVNLIFDLAVSTNQLNEFKNYLFGWLILNLIYKISVPMSNNEMDDEEIKSNLDCYMKLIKDEEIQSKIYQLKKPLMDGYALALEMLEHWPPIPPLKMMDVILQHIRKYLCGSNDS